MAGLSSSLIIVHLVTVFGFWLRLICLNLHHVPVLPVFGSLVCTAFFVVGPFLSVALVAIRLAFPLLAAWLLFRLCLFVKCRGKLTHSKLWLRQVACCISPVVLVALNLYMLWCFMAWVVVPLTWLFSVKTKKLCPTLRRSVLLGVRFLSSSVVITICISRKAWLWPTCCSMVAGVMRLLSTLVVVAILILLLLVLPSLVSARALALMAFF